MQLSCTAVAVADAIHDFRFKTVPYDTSPPNLTQEQQTIRNLAIIDLTNAVAEALLIEGDLLDKDAFLSRSLTRRP